ncbi:MAG: sn-glycerol-3-phosphate ABC transporter ATP-binding protein UgpC [Elusimicrobiota bacterium]|jgi:multiple sugar transport system ATP-binding protein|nr:sn-glycerol-3-phosphate ABC transporter ATP-binding protein UgpC [Elusimicrobiota bacterium]
MADIALKNVCKIYSDNYETVKKINFEIKDKEFCVLVGPSGCGKSTILRMIAGLEEITSGELYIDGKIVNEVPAKNRDIAMVFQNYALYPHMTVYENMAFALKLRKYSKSEIDVRVKEAAEILDISKVLNRKPKELSGGQKQRVALGRTIVRKPKVFLFDEPLSNLDAKLRISMRTEIKKLHEKLQATIIYVTHDQIEAMTMGDKIVVVRNGSIEQISSPMELYNKPVSQFVAGFIGSPSMNFLNVKIIEKNNSLFLKDDTFEVKIPDNFENILEKYVSKNVIFGIRAEDIYDKMFSIATTENVARVNIDLVEHLGSETFLYLILGKQKLIARVEPQNSSKTGQDIDIVFNLQKMQIFDNETGENLLLKK